MPIGQGQSRPGDAALERGASTVAAKNQPYYIYKNGRSFMLSLNFKL